MNAAQVFQDTLAKREKQCVILYCGRPGPWIEECFERCAKRSVLELMRRVTRHVHTQKPEKHSTSGRHTPHPVCICSVSITEPIIFERNPRATERPNNQESLIFVANQNSRRAFPYLSFRERVLRKLDLYISKPRWIPQTIHNSTC